MPKISGLLCLFLLVSAEVTAQKADKLYKEGMTLFNGGNYEKALDKFIQALDNKPSDTGKIYYAMGNCYQYLEKQDQSIKNYELALFYRFKDTPEVYYQLSTCYFLKREYERSIEYCNKILALNPKSPDRRVYSRLNIIYSILGDSAKATEAIVMGARAGIAEFQKNCERRGIKWLE